MAECNHVFIGRVDGVHFVRCGAIFSLFSQNLVKSGNMGEARKKGNKKPLY